MSRVSVVAAAIVLAGVVVPGASSAAEPDVPPGRTLYVTNGDSRTVSISTITATGDLAPLGDPVRTAARPRGIVFSPNGMTAYVLNFGDKNVVSTFRVGTSGELIASGPDVATGTIPFGIAVSPRGQAVYVTDGPDATVRAFAVRDGTLEPAGAPIKVGDGTQSARGVAVSPDGRHVFVSVGDPTDTETRPGKLVTFAVNPANHTLELRTTTMIAPGPFGVGITPDGRFLYVACSFTNEILPFEIAYDGGLTRLPAASAPEFPVSTVVSADGRMLFVASEARITGTPKGVWVFQIGDRGTLSPVGSGPTAAGGRPVWPAATPDNRFLYVSNEDNSRDLFGFTIRNTGALVPLSGSPFDARGEFSMFQSTAVRPNQGPAATFSATPGAAGQPTAFNASASSDSDGRITRYDWNFGDGTVAANAGPTPRHIFATPGRYQVTLTVTDNEGCSTRLVFTGQLASCNGSSAATTRREVVIPSSG